MLRHFTANLRPTFYTTCRHFSSSTHYTDVLGVSHTDSFATIKAAFQALAKENHPDLNPDADERKMQMLLEAYSDAKEEFDFDGSGGEVSLVWVLAHTLKVH